jgi:hypothetical protein
MIIRPETDAFKLTFRLNFVFAPISMDPPSASKKQKSSKLTHSLIEMLFGPLTLQPLPSLAPLPKDFKAINAHKTLSN